MADYGVCQVCKNRPAKLVVLRRHSDNVYRTFVCPDCANERVKVYSGESLDFERLLSGVARGSGIGQKPAFECRMCGATLAEIVVDGRPGCCACYSRFEGEIEQVVRNTQGCTQHVGKGLER